MLYHPVLLGLAGFIVLGLSIVAIVLWLKVLKKQKAERETAIALDRSLEEKRARLAEDIRFIAKAMLTEQCEITEGCLRLKVLLDLLDQRFTQHPKLTNLQSYYAKVAHYPTHQAYKDLSKAEQFKLDKERYSLEQMHKEHLLKEAEALTAFDLNWIQSVQLH